MTKYGRNFTHYEKLHRESTEALVSGICVCVAFGSWQTTVNWCCVCGLFVAKTKSHPCEQSAKKRMGTMTSLYFQNTSSATACMLFYMESCFVSILPHNTNQEITHSRKLTCSIHYLLYKDGEKATDRCEFAKRSVCYIAWSSRNVMGDE